MVRIGILGTARIAPLYFGGLLRHAQFVAVASRSADRAAGFAERHGLGRWHDSYDALIEDPGVDALYIPLPNHMHAEYAIRAVRAGKHVLVEKPAALTSADFRRMTEASTSAGVLLMEAMMWRFKRIHRRVLELVRGGSLGDLRHVDFHWCYPLRALDRGAFRLDPACGGGALNDVGVYGVDFLHQLMGGELEVRYAAMEREEEGGVDLFTHALLASKGATATLTCGYTSDANYYVLACEKGMIHVPGSVAGRVVENRALMHRIDGDDRSEERFAAENPYHALLDHFAACVLGKETPMITPEETGQNLDLLGRIREAEVTLRSASGR